MNYSPHPAPANPGPVVISILQVTYHYPLRSRSMDKFMVFKINAYVVDIRFGRSGTEKHQVTFL